MTELNNNTMFLYNTYTTRERGIPNPFNLLVPVLYQTNAVVGSLPTTYLKWIITAKGSGDVIDSVLSACKGQSKVAIQVHWLFYLRILW